MQGRRPSQVRQDKRSKVKGPYYVPSAEFEMILFIEVMLGKQHTYTYEIDRFLVIFHFVYRLPTIVVNFYEMNEYLCPTTRYGTYHL